MNITVPKFKVVQSLKHIGENPLDQYIVMSIGLNDNKTEWLYLCYVITEKEDYVVEVAEKNLLTNCRHMEELTKSQAEYRMSVLDKALASIDREYQNLLMINTDKRLDGVIVNLELTIQGINDELNELGSIK